MNYKLLVLNKNKPEVEKISSALKSAFNNIEIFNPQETDYTVDILKTFFPDIILYDLDSTENSFDTNLVLITEIKNLPIVALSSSDKYNEAFKAGAINFIQKPFTDITLISNLKTLFNHLSVLKAIKIKEEEIKDKNEKIRFQIENELKQRDIIIRKNKDIMADIRYASRIQQAILPSLEVMDSSIFEYFILHQPKSHVSGDFYWISNQNNKKIIAVGDCTGHGISGGLMHMLGAVYLNEIVSRNDFEKASDILEQLREHIMLSLNQKGESGETQNGMDIALCIIDCEDHSLQFSGANNPLYLIRNKMLTEIKGDRMPVGIHVNFNKPFSNHLVTIESSDKIYLFSDGFADQFGGSFGKKYRYKQFKELLVKTSHEPMNIQKEILNNEHDKWRGSADQIDDILVFGLKIK